MFDIVFAQIKELFDWLPMIALFVIVISMIGGMVFKK